jgi:hypothetical protein
MEHVSVGRLGKVHPARGRGGSGTMAWWRLDDVLFQVSSPSMENPETFPFLGIVSFDVGMDLLFS